MENNEETFQSKLAAYQKAIQEEYDVVKNAATKTTQGEKEEVVEELFNKNIALAAAQIIHLMQFSSSDSTRLAAAKYVLDRKPADGSTDPIAALIKQLQTKKPATATATADATTDTSGSE